MADSAVTESSADWQSAGESGWKPTFRLAEPAGDWVATVQEVAPGSAELVWVVMDFLALVLPY